LAVITTIEAEHLDTYLGLGEIQDAFVEFANRIPFYGSVILCKDDPGVQEILPRIKRPITTYSSQSEADYRAADVEFETIFSRYRLLQYGKPSVSVELQVPGMHNVANSLAAMAVAAEVDIPLDIAARALGNFTGVKRRFEIYGETAGVLIVCDFAHHPTEIQMTIETARRGWERRIVVLFQPHLFTRTRDFAEEFGKALAQADVVLATDIYPAREKPLPGVTGRLVAESTRAAGCRDVHFCADHAAIEESLQKTLRPGDLLIVMGAGDIWKIAQELSGRKSF